MTDSPALVDPAHPGEPDGDSPRWLRPFAPSALGRDFRWLWSASATSNLGDGVLLAAGPLLVTTLTREPITVAAAAFLQELPWVVFGIPAGAVVDRIDRRLLASGVNVVRAVILGLLALSIFGGHVSLPVVLSVSFLLGSAEVFADIADGALVATRVPKPVLGQANARLIGTSIITNQLAGPSIGALLFAVAAVLPFGVDAVAALAAAVMILRIAPEPPRLPTSSKEPTHIRQDIAEGVRWLWHHPPLRTLALTIFCFNVTFWAAYSVYVLLARERLGLDEVGFGLLLTVGAVGGLVGSVAYPWLERHFALATLMRAGLLLETITHLILALATSAIVVSVTMLLFGIHATVWGTTSTTVRQRAVPANLLGRVASVSTLAAVGGSSIGAIVGGVLAQQLGLTAPFWFGFFGSAILLALIWKSLDAIAHAPEAEAEAEALAAIGPAAPTTAEPS